VKLKTHTIITIIVLYVRYLLQKLSYDLFNTTLNIK